jgi:hypothetical protein
MTLACMTIRRVALSGVLTGLAARRHAEQYGAFRATLARCRRHFPRVTLAWCRSHVCVLLARLPRIAAAGPAD